MRCSDRVCSQETVLSFCVTLAQSFRGGLLSNGSQAIRLQPGIRIVQVVDEDTVGSSFNTSVPAGVVYIPVGCNVGHWMDVCLLNDICCDTGAYL